MTTIAVTGLPATIDAGGRAPRDFIGWYLDNKSEIEGLLLRRGAVKFEGVRIRSVDDFQETVRAISDRFMDYIDGNSPRTKLSGSVYTSTEFDKTRKITMHNELSYSAKWPGKLFFSCLQPSETGGETLLADSRRILENMDDELVADIEKKGITYIRNLHGGEGLGPSWQETFETTEKSLLEKYCREYAIAFEWQANGGVRLKQTRQGIIRHRLTGEKVWFNQIDQFHPCHLGEELYEITRFMYDGVENFPMYVSFGDGSAISEGTVRQILSAIEEVTLAPVWKRDELLLVDNELVSHGRNPYTGARKVLVAMSE